MKDYSERIPAGFASHMRELLGDEYDELESALLSDRSFGLRVNPLKFNKERALGLRDELGITDVIKWCDEGFYYNEEARPGKSPFHEAGAFYIQEPSAMTVVQALDPKPGERVCDLCAAPGGKATHIAGRLRGRGLLVANEIVTDRARILSRNIERMGVANCLVTNEDPESMMNRFPGFFHRVVVDAPCSGEGMFRKEDAAVSEWSMENVSMCSGRQLDILDCAEKMVMPGGTLVYSTCTFEPDEDENVIGEFLKQHTDWRIVSAGFEDVCEKGRPEWMSDPSEELALAVRIWPHKQRGEGHFLAKLIRNGEYPVMPEQADGGCGTETFAEPDADKPKHKKKGKGSKGGNEEAAGNVFEQTKEFVKALTGENIITERLNRDKMMRMADCIYLLPPGITPEMLRGFKTVRPGLCLAEICKDRLEPSHSLAMAISTEGFAPADDMCGCKSKLCENGTLYEYRMDIDEAYKFMRGETIPTFLDQRLNGKWLLMSVEGVSIGWGKYVNGMIKNHYPKGLRRQ